MRGMLDRIEDGMMAVILLEEAQGEVILPLNELPEGSKAGSWFHMELRQGEVVSIELDRSAEQQQQKKAESVLAKLRSKSAKSRFRRK